MINHAERIWEICCGCAETVYDHQPPMPEYAHRTAMLLFGTAAQESGLRWERQRTPRWEGNVGGFGKWQVEQESIRRSLHNLRARPELLSRATDWLFADPNAPMTWPSTISMDSVLWALRLDDNDKIGVLFARLHYMRVPGPIPESVAEQAAYWKEYYNTPLGKGTVEEYLKNWKRYCAKMDNLHKMDNLDK